MNKIIVIGSCGAGKSGVAKEISKKFDIPLISLDQLYWRPGWERTPREEWREKVGELVRRGRWVMDGNYKNTFDIRFPACDTVVLLDVNRFVCFWRIWKRRILKNRVDELNNCNEKINLKMLKWVLWDYPGRGKKEIFEYMEKCSNKKIIIIKSKKQLNGIWK